MGLTYREGLNRPLTAAEIDGNFQHFTGSHAVTGSVTVSEGFYGDLIGTATTASYVAEALTAVTASYVAQAETALFAQDSAGQVVEITYLDLYDKIDEGELVPGKYYLITDFCTVYDRPDFYVDGDKKDSGIVTVSGSVSPLLVFATAPSKLAEEAYQPQYPNDRIKYDVNYSNTDQNSTPAKGRITERIDEYRNRTDYDHREIEFKRYLSYEQSSQLTGTIISYNASNGELVGDGSTVFDQELSEGDVIMLDTRNSMGWSYNVGVKINSIENENLIIAYIDPAYNNINFVSANVDFYGAYGVDYASYKEYYVGQSTENEYRLSKTFVNLDNGDVVGNYVGDYSKYYLQGVSSNSGFLLANNVFLNQCYSNKIGDRSYNNTGRQWFINNVIGNKFQNNIIWRGFYQNQIGSDFSNNILEYSVYGNEIGNYFEWNYTTGNNGYIYDNKIGNYFNGNEIKYQVRENIIGSYFESNIVDRDLYRNKIGNDFYNNRNYGELYNNVIGNGFGNNGISGSFGFNNIGDYFYRNDIYNSFIENTITKNFEFNTIGQEGNNNIWSFQNNKIGGYCEGNTIEHLYSYNTTVGEFRGNIIPEDCTRNHFGHPFNNNSFTAKLIGNRANTEFSGNYDVPQLENNTFDCEVNGLDLSSSTHLTQNYTCHIYRDRTDGLRLSYMDEGALEVALITD